MKTDTKLLLAWIALLLDASGVVVMLIVFMLTRYSVFPSIVFTVWYCIASTIVAGVLVVFIEKWSIKSLKENRRTKND